MNIAEHEVKLSILPKKRKANILDLGCRGFEFSNFFREKHNVYCVDIGELDSENYFTVAISDKDGWCGIEKNQDPQAWRIKEGNELKMMTIKSFSEFVNVRHWDVIKMDIEGEEYNILNSAEHPIADQISVEFHAHTGRQTKEQLDILLNKLKQWYWIEGAHWVDKHCAGFNYWDVLLIRK